MRFFNLFYVVRDVSIMMLTVNSMLVDVIPFMIIFIWWILFAAQIFWTYYADLNPSNFNDET